MLTDFERLLAFAIIYIVVATGVAHYRFFREKASPDIALISGVFWWIYFIAKLLEWTITAVERKKE